MLPAPDTVTVNRGQTDSNTIYQYNSRPVCGPTISVMCNYSSDLYE